MTATIHTPHHYTHSGVFMFALFSISAMFAGTMTIAACSNARVFSDTDPNARFGAYRTFALVEEPHRVPKQSRHSAEIMEATIEQGIEKEMQRRGYTVDETLPDLLVKYSIEVDVDTKRVSEPIYRSRPVVAVGGIWRPRYYVTRTPVVVGSRTRTVTHKEGVLTIDVIDRASGKVIWHGWSEEPINTRAELATALMDNVREIMNAYPVSAR